MVENYQSRMRIFVAACVAPCASPLLTAGYAWVMLHVGAQADELGRWFQFGDLWSLFLGEFVVALVFMWCVGFPVFAVARSRNALSGFGMCIAGALTGVLLSLLAATIVSLPEFSFWLVLIAVAVGAMKGVAVAGAFSWLVGIPRFAPHSKLSQRDIAKSDV